jgi:hypothetical protein
MSALKEIKAGNLRPQPTMKIVNYLRYDPKRDQPSPQEIFQIVSRTQKFFDSFLKPRKWNGVFRIESNKVLEDFMDSHRAISLKMPKYPSSKMPATRENMWVGMNSELSSRFRKTLTTRILGPERLAIKDIKDPPTFTAKSGLKNVIFISIPPVRHEVSNHFVTDPSQPIDQLERLIMLYPDLPRLKANRNKPFIILKDKTVARLDPEPPINCFAGSDLEPLRELLQAQVINTSLRSHQSLKRLSLVLPLLSHVQQVLVKIPGTLRFQTKPLEENIFMIQGVIGLIRACKSLNELKEVVISKAVLAENHEWENGDEKAIVLLSGLPGSVRRIQYKHFVIRNLDRTCRSPVL